MSRPRRQAECHPDRPHKAKGLCGYCYQRGVVERGGIRRWNLKRIHGLTLEQYDELLAEQGGGCAICGNPPKGGKNLHVDHDHVTGVVRGLLCHHCNTALGNLGDNPTLIRKAASYLETYA